MCVAAFLFDIACWRTMHNALQAAAMATAEERERDAIYHLSKQTADKARLVSFSSLLMH